MGKLYIIPTPIGNLEDITFRAIRILKESDLVLAEDTRQTIKLFKKYDIKVPLKSYHQFNEHKISELIVSELTGNKVFSLVSDAGTPGISDPAYLIVNQCIKNNILVECLPGATAFIPALIESGLPSDSFIFEGFLPHKKGKRSKIKQISEETKTVIVYESPYRLMNTLTLLKEMCEEERKISVSRELTKIYAETIRGTIADVIKHFESKQVIGEFVIIIDGKK